MVDILFTFLMMLLLVLLVLGALWVAKMIMSAAEITDPNVRKIILVIIGLVGVILVVLLLIRQAGPAPIRF